MSTPAKDKRIGGASALLRDIAALDKVGAEHRAVYLHERLMAAIDDICEENKGNGSGAGFSKRQIEILKSISFNIVYILDRQNLRDQSVVRRTWQDFSKSNLKDKVGTISTVILILGAVSGFAYWAWPQLSRLRLSVEPAIVAQPPGAIESRQSPSGPAKP